MEPTTAAGGFLTSFVLVGPFVASLRPRFPGPTGPGNARKGRRDYSPEGPGVDTEGHRPASRAAEGDLRHRRIPGPEGAVTQLVHYRRVSRASYVPGPYVKCPFRTP